MWNHCLCFSCYGHLLFKAACFWISTLKALSWKPFNVTEEHLTPTDKLIRISCYGDDRIYSCLGEMFADEKRVLVVTESTEGDDFIPMITKIGTADNRREGGGTPEIFRFCCKCLWLTKTKTSHCVLLCSPNQRGDVCAFAWCTLVTNAAKWHRSYCWNYNSATRSAGSANITMPWRCTLVSPEIHTLWPHPTRPELHFECTCLQLLSQNLTCTYT